jgi:hypothetical protein
LDAAHAVFINHTCDIFLLMLMLMLLLLLLLLLLQELEAIGAGPELDRLVEELEARSGAPSRK